MESIVVYTEEIDDLEYAARELVSGAEDFAFRKNTLGILFAEDETEFEELYGILSESWSFPIIGCSGMALMTAEGYCSGGISILLLTADDCTFTAGMTGELGHDNYKEEIEKTYRELAAGHEEDIRLIISFGGMVTSEENVAGDELVYALNEVSGGVPIYGGTAADSFSFDNFHLFCNGEVTTNGQTMALISGNIDPRFAVINSVKNRASFSYEVTEAKSNLVYRLGSGSFIDALKRENLESEKTDVLGDYILSPFVVDIKKGDGDSVEVARNLSSLNQETGSGAFLGAIPEGAVLNIGIINRADVQSSVQDAFEKIFEDIRVSGSEYHTLMCTSCCARFMALSGDTSAEVQTYIGKLPEGVSLSGFYAFGEYCPVEGNRTGREYNMFHNFTFTIMAL